MRITNRLPTNVVHKTCHLFLKLQYRLQTSFEPKKFHLLLIMMENITFMSTRFVWLELTNDASWHFTSATFLCNHVGHLLEYL